MKTKFIFLILPQLQLLDLAGPDQVIHEAINFGAEFTIEYCSLQNETKTTTGLSFANLKHFSEIEIGKGDYLIIPGPKSTTMLSGEIRKQTELLSWINRLHNQKIKFVSICSGAYLLAECGLLNNISCTTHFKLTKKLQETFPKARVAENILFTQHENIYTSAGIASGIDLMLHIIEEIKGNYFSHLVAREMVVYNRRNGNQQQESELLRFRNHIHSGIHKVQDWLIENINQKSNLNELAEIANMSERNFTRVFKKETNITVNNYVTLIRKEKIKELLKNPDYSRVEIALNVGLQSERQLSRLINSN